VQVEAGVAVGGGAEAVVVGGAAGEGVGGAGRRRRPGVRAGVRTRARGIGYCRRGVGKRGRGVRATGIARTNFFSTRSISDTLPEVTFDVNTRFPSAVIAAMWEPCATVGIAASTVPVSIFTMTTLPVDSEVTTTRVSSPGMNTTPCGRVYWPSEMVRTTVPEAMSMIASSLPGGRCP
jgi:hypothetical protein